MKKILFIIPQAFHDKSNNAGEKVINYYIKKFSLEFDVTVLLSYDKNNLETDLMLRNTPRINFVYCFEKKGIINRFIDGIIKSQFYYKLLPKFSSKNYVTNGFVANGLNQAISKLQNPNVYDVVIVEFPILLFQSKIIVEKFVNAKLIASVHDVSFQSLERYLEINKVWINKDKYFSNFKKNEIENLKNFDLLVTLCDKDKKLIENELDKTKKILTIHPYFDSYDYIKQNADGICFFGSMSRSENENSMVWFIDNVWTKVTNKSLKLYIVGGGVTENLSNCSSKYNNIILTGFVSDPLPFFNKCFAMIVPLQFGAGIKIKTLEALASGIPLISNKIGIEGIQVKDNIEYLHCESPIEWVKAIEMIVSDVSLGDQLSINSKLYMSQNYNLNESFEEYKMKICELISE